MEAGWEIAAAPARDIPPPVFAIAEYSPRRTAQKRRRQTTIEPIGEKYPNFSLAARGSNLYSIMMRIMQRWTFRYYGNEVSR